MADVKPEISTEAIGYALSEVDLEVMTGDIGKGWEDSQEFLPL